MHRYIDTFLLSKNEKKAYALIFLSSCLFSLSIIQSNILYVDDYRRVLTGGTYWSTDGRMLSTFLSLLLQLGDPLTDISPLPQIASIALYSLSAIYLGKAYKVNDLNLLVLSGFAFVMNPFNLQCFSYIFDSFTMGAAILSATLAFLNLVALTEGRFQIQAHKIISTLSVLLLTASLLLYQSATSIYLAAFSLYLLLALIQGEHIRTSIANCIHFLSVFTLSLPLYVLVNWFYHDRSNDSKFELYSLFDLPKIFTINLPEAWLTVYKFLGNGSLLLVSLSLIGIFFAGLLIVFCQEKPLLNKKKVYVVIWSSLIGLYILLAILSIQGLALILMKPLLLPRTYMGANMLGIICFILSILFRESKIKRSILIVFFCTLCLLFGNVSLTLGNLYHYQSIQNEMVSTMLISDIESELPNVSGREEDLKIEMSGSLKPGELLLKGYEKYPILRKIIYQIRGDSFHSYLQLKSYGLSSLKFIRSDNVGQELSPQESKNIANNQFYSIYYIESESKFIVRFKDRRDA